MKVVDDMRTKIIAICIILALLPSVTFIDGVSAEPYEIVLLDSGGEPIDEDDSLVQKVVEFVTWTDKDGTKYMLPEDTEISLPEDHYLRINSTIDEFFKIKVTALGLEKNPQGRDKTVLEETGVKVTLQTVVNEVMKTYTVELTANDDFQGYFMDGTAAAELSPNKSYLIKIYTDEEFAEAGEYTTEVPKASTDVSLRFEPEPVAGYVVTFMNDDQVWDTKVVPEGETVAQMPADPTKEDYSFDGWFDENDQRFTSQTVVNSNMTVHSKWTEITPPEPPGPDPPIPPDPPVPPERHEIIEEEIINDDGSISEIETKIDEWSDGSKNI